MLQRLQVRKEGGAGTMLCCGCVNMQTLAILQLACITSLLAWLERCQTWLFATTGKTQNVVNGCGLVLSCLATFARVTCWWSVELASRQILPPTPATPSYT